METLSPLRAAICSRIARVAPNSRSAGWYGSVAVPMAMCSPCNFFHAQVAAGERPGILLDVNFLSRNPRPSSSMYSCVYRA